MTPADYRALREERLLFGGMARRTSSISASSCTPVNCSTPLKISSTETAFAATSRRSARRDSERAARCVHGETPGRHRRGV